MIAGINESKTLTKHVSCKCKSKFDSRKCNSIQKWNNDKSRCECNNPKEHVMCEKDILNPAACTCENGKYLDSTIDGSVITCGEIIEVTKTVPTKGTSRNIYIFLTFLLITTITL